MARGKSFKSLELIDAAYKILKEIHPASVRAVCYKLFTKGFIDGMGKKNTNRVSRLLTKAREDEQIPWDWFVDENREDERPQTWADPQSFARAAQKSFRRDRWQYQSTHVEVWSEKGTIRGALWPVLDAWGVTFRNLHGYDSTTRAHDIAQLSQCYREQNKTCVVLYVGDWDPSGLDMSERDLPKRLARYGGEIELRRIALERGDLSSLPPFDLESKRGDSRYKWYKDNFSHGGRCWEVDAMDPRELRNRVEAKVVEFIEPVAWDRCAVSEKAELDSLKQVLNTWQSHHPPGPN